MCEGGKGGRGGGRGNDTLPCAYTHDARFRDDNGRCLRTLDVNLHLRRARAVHVVSLRLTGQAAKAHPQILEATRTRFW